MHWVSISRRVVVVLRRDSGATRFAPFESVERAKGTAFTVKSLWLGWVIVTHAFSAQLPWRPPVHFWSEWRRAGAVDRTTAGLIFVR